MSAKTYIQGRVVSVCSCNTFVIELDGLYAEAFFNRRETVIITDIPSMPFWTPRAVRLKRLLRTAISEKRVGLTVEGRNESGHLCVDTSGFSAYMGEK